MGEGRQYPAKTTAFALASLPVVGHWAGAGLREALGNSLYSWLVLSRFWACLITWPWGGFLFALGGLLCLDALGLKLGQAAAQVRWQGADDDHCVGGAIRH